MIRRGLTRREFVRLAGASAFAAWPSPSRPEDPRQARKPPGPGLPLSVALVPCPDYAPATLAAAIETGWRASRPPGIKGRRVVIKPNIADFAPERPIHTDMRLVEALILHLKGLGAREIVLAEGPPHNRDSEWLFRAAGYASLARRQGVLLVDLNYDDVAR